MKRKVSALILSLDILTLYNVCAVPWGCSVPWGYHEYHGGYLEYREVFSTMGDILSTVAVILDTVGDTQYRGGYHDACVGTS